MPPGGAYRFARQATTATIDWFVRNSAREPVAEHRPPAFRFGFGRLVLKHVPVLGEAAILDPDHVSSDSCDGAALTREAAMENHIVALRQDNTGLIAESVRRATDKIE